MGYDGVQTISLPIEYPRRVGETKSVDKWVKSALNLLFPQFCINCKTLGFSLCPDCTKKLRGELIDFPLCFICENLCINGETHKACSPKSNMSRFFAPYLYKGVAKKILQSKSKNPLLIKYLLGNADQSDYMEFLMKTDLIIPIPPSPKYLNPRLIEPTDIIAEHISNTLHKPIYKALYKSPMAKQQKKLDLSKRMFPKIQIRKDAFKLMKNKRLLLVDDVCTSGSTLNISAGILRSYGAAEVNGYALARDLRYNRA
jgi:predicted amidophosphoribosyltransferase